MSYTVKQLADIANITVRTLHYYDQIELLKPARLGENGYRQYDETAVMRLQQILFYREHDFNLKAIKAILDQPNFDLLQALHKQKADLQNKTNRLQRLIETVDKTILHVTGMVEMDKKEMFAEFTKEKEAQYKQEAEEQFGVDAVAASYKRWNKYGAAKQNEIKAEGKAIYAAILLHMEKGHDSPEIQAQIAALHNHMEYFYTCSNGRFRGLGQMYSTHPSFVATYQTMHPALPQFLTKAIEFYCQEKQ